MIDLIDRRLRERLADLLFPVSRCWSPMLLPKDHLHLHTNYRRSVLGCRRASRVRPALKASQAGMGLTLYHLQDSRSLKVLWLLEELGVDYDLKIYERLETKYAPPELKEVHPLGKSPVIKDGDLTIAESTLIIEYLIEEYGPHLAPPKSEKAKTLDYKYWMHFTEGTAQPVLLVGLLMNVIKVQSPFFLRPIVSLVTNAVSKLYVGFNVDAHNKFMDEAVAKNPKGWFVDDFSGADIALSFPVECTSVRQGLSEFPHLKKFLDQVHERPAYKRALEREGSLTCMTGHGRSFEFNERSEQMWAEQAKFL